MASLGTSFSTQGATPAPNLAGYGMSPASGSTPQAKALSSFGLSSMILPQKPTVPNNGVQAKILPNNPVNAYAGPGTQAYVAPSLGTNPGLLPPVNQDVKSHTSADGTSQTYYPSSQASSGSASAPSPAPSPAPAQPPVLTPAQFAASQGSGYGTATPASAAAAASGPAVPATNASALTYPGLIGSAVNSAQSNQSIGSNAAQIAAQYGTNISNINQQGNAAQAGYLTTGTSPVAEGNAAVIANTQANQVAGQAAAEQAALQGTGQQLTAQNQTTNGLIGAAGLAAPIQAPYSNQIIDPTTGQPIGGGAAGTLPAAAQNAVNTYAQQVLNGQMTRDEAQSLLSAYGPAGTNALTSALGSNFNTNASNASAATTQQGQQLQTAATATNAALTTLQQLYDNLPVTTGIPGINSIGNTIASKLGSSELSTYNQTLADARAQLQGVLTASGAATPTGAESAALTYLPDNMTPEQLKANIANVQQLVQQKVSSFTNSGQQPSGSSSGGAMFGSFFSS